jgi:hypothetical protein
MKHILTFALSIFVTFGLVHMASAADTIESATYLDTNGDGSVDTIRLTMDEPTASCAFEAGDWSSTSGNIDIASIDGVSCDGNNINLTVTADADATGDNASLGGAAPEISYDASAGTAGSIVLNSGAMTDKTDITVADGAAPTVKEEFFWNIIDGEEGIIEVEGTDGATGIDPTGKILGVFFRFSEEMDFTGLSLNNGLTVSPSIGATALNSDETTAYLVSDEFVCGTTYEISIQPDDLAAAAGTPTVPLTTGTEDGTFTFTTIPCAGGSTQQSVQIVEPFIRAGDVEPVAINAPLTTTWEAGGMGLGFVDVYLSEDAGETYEQVASNVNAGLGRYTLTAPAMATTARIKLVGTDLVTDLMSVETNSFSVVGGDRAQNHNSSRSNRTEPVSIGDDLDSDDDGLGDGAEDVALINDVRPGDAITVVGSDAVYYITDRGTKRVFINAQSYFTWFDSFENVKEVSMQVVAAFPLEGVMLPKADVVLVKIQSSSAVYALTDDNGDLTPELRMIPSEEVAAALYGADWADYVIDIPPTFFASFDMGDEYTESTNVDSSGMRKRSDLN